MSWTTVRQEVRWMRFEELYERRQRRELTMADAAAMLGVTERTFRRWSGRYEGGGAGGIAGPTSGAGLGPSGPRRRSPADGDAV